MEGCARGEAGSSGADGVVLRSGGQRPCSSTRPSAGFSFQKDGPLDMRMSQSRAQRAADAVNHLEANELAAIFRDLWRGAPGAPRRPGDRARPRDPSRSPRTLAPGGDRRRRRSAASPGRIHPATRAFQGLRIYVNDELGELVRGFAARPNAFAEGRRAVGGGHLPLAGRPHREDLLCGSARAWWAAARVTSRKSSLESRAELFADQRRRRFPPVRHAEAAENPRARSAKLRAESVTANPAAPAFDRPDSALPGAAAL
jgi:16S rRNA (cytosine1402-N4)-methyltransferase